MVLWGPKSRLKPNARVLAKGKLSENVRLIESLRLRHISQGEGEQDFSLPTQTRGGSLMHIHEWIDYKMRGKSPPRKWH